MADRAPMIRAEIRDAVATITLDRPARRNALTVEMVDELTAALDALEADADVGAIVVTGAGSAFCAGADLGHLGQAAGGDAAAEAVVVSIYRAFTRLRDCALPTVAAVNGPAVGAGLNLALACDLRLAGRAARFSSRFLSLGLHPGGGHAWLMLEAVGREATLAVTLFGQDLEGEQAERIGLVWRTVDDAELADEASAIARAAVCAPREVARALKQTIREARSTSSYPEAIEANRQQLWSAGREDFRVRIAEASGPRRTQG